MYPLINDIKSYIFGKKLKIKERERDNNNNQLSSIND